MRRIFVSRCAWSFFASWYSEFSLRSPHSRAVLIRSAISRRATVSSCSSSACSAWCASAVIRTRSVKPVSLVLRLKTATPFAVVAHRHQRVRDPRAQHEVTRIADEHDRVRLPRHRDRWVAASGQKGLQALPDGGWLGGEDRDAVDGGFHAAALYTNICSYASGNRSAAQNAAGSAIAPTLASHSVIAWPWVTTMSGRCSRTAASKRATTSSC